jgi:type I restriction enzyme M protein
MLTTETRRRVDAIWDRVWASGVSNPLTAIEYLSTILLLRRLKDRRAGDPSGDLWRELVNHTASGDPAAVAGLMLRVQSEFGIGASPDVAAPSTWRDLVTLNEVLCEIAQLDLTDQNHDILGDLFEYMLGHLSSAGHFGQFRTPRHLIRFIVDVVDPKAGEVVADPGCGTAGFLVAAHEHRGGEQERYLGDEVDATIARIAHTNMLLHGMRGAEIRHGDGLAHHERDADVILANPPFAGSVIAERVAGFKSGTLKTELLFLELMCNRLTRGGRAGVVVPTGVLTSPSAGAVWVRRQLLESNRLAAVVELPGGVFRPYTDVKTAVLFWSNEAPGDDVLLIKVAADGYSLDDRRDPVVQNDLPHAAALLTGGVAPLANARVAIAEIATQRYNLSPSRYIVQLDDGPPGMPPVGLEQALRDSRGSLKLAREALARMEALL